MRNNIHVSFGELTVFLDIFPSGTADVIISEERNAEIKNHLTECEYCKAWAQGLSTADFKGEARRLTTAKTRN